MDQKTIEALGDSLYDALVARTPIAPLSAAHPDMTIEDAYHVQQRMIARRLEKGDRVIGKKIGVTSKAVMNMLGVHQPDFGFLTDWMHVQGDIDIDAKALIAPRCGENAADVLTKAEVFVYHSIPGTARQNIEAHLNNQLPLINEFHAGFHGHEKK